MIRSLLDDALLFLLPFVLFGLYLAFTRRSPFHRPHWEGRLAVLAGAGLAVVIASFLLAGLLGHRDHDGFVPTHLEDGRVVPGRFK